MKAVIQINVADDDGMQVIANMQYIGAIKSYTIPSSATQIEVLKTIIDKVKAQVRSELVVPGLQ